MGHAIHIAIHSNQEKVKEMPNDDLEATNFHEDYVQGYKDGFRSIQGNVVVPIAPAVSGLAGISRYDQGFADGVKDAEL